MGQHIYLLHLRIRNRIANNLLYFLQLPNLPTIFTSIFKPLSLRFLLLVP